jgi:branched-chain amino acid transport system permease protein
VIVIGGLGSLRGALWASLLVGCLQSWAVMADVSLAGLLGRLGWPLETSHPWHRLLSWQLSDLAPVLPFLLLVLMLVYRPRGLMGQRDR